MSAAEVFRITDEDGDVLEFLDDHTDEDRIRVTMNDDTSVYLTLDDLGKLRDALGTMFYRREDQRPTPVSAG